MRGERVAACISSLHPATEPPPACRPRAQHAGGNAAGISLMGGKGRTMSSKLPSPEEGGGAVGGADFLAACTRRRGGSYVCVQNLVFKEAPGPEHNARYLQTAAPSSVYGPGVLAYYAVRLFLDRVTRIDPSKQ